MVSTSETISGLRLCCAANSFDFLRSCSSLASSLGSHPAFALTNPTWSVMRNLSASRTTIAASQLSIEIRSWLSSFSTSTLLALRLCKSIECALRLLQAQETANSRVRYLDTEQHRLHHKVVVLMTERSVHRRWKRAQTSKEGFDLFLLHGCFPLSSFSER